MVILGVDAHKRSHTVVAVDEAGCDWRRSAQATQEGHLALLGCATRFEVRRWAVEDCPTSRATWNGTSCRRRAIVRVPPKLMVNARDAARIYGNSDPIDALGLARAALREPRLTPVACSCSNGR